MANDLLIIMCASTTAGTMPLYLEQLSAAGIDYWIEDASRYDFFHRGAFISEKIRILRDLVNRFSLYRHLIFSDAFDVTFYGEKEQLLAQLPKDYVLLAAEKNCYPNPSLIPLIPNRGPWRFVNGGLSAGTPEAFLHWMNEIERHPSYRADMIDQGFLNELLAAMDPLVQIDFETRFFFCLYGGYEELEWKAGKPFNAYWNTYPSFVHANGKWDATEAFRKRDESCLTTQRSAR